MRGEKREREGGGESRDQRCPLHTSKITQHILIALIHMGVQHKTKMEKVQPSRIIDDDADNEWV